MSATRVDMQPWRHGGGAQPTNVEQRDRWDGTAALAAVDGVLLGGRADCKAKRRRGPTERGLAVHTAGQPLTLERSKACIPCDGLDDVCLMTGGRGRMDAGMRGEDALSHGHVVLFDVGRPHTKTALTPHDELRLSVPRRVFAERVGHIEELAGLRISSRGALAILFTRYLADLSAAMPALTGVEAKAGIDGLLHLLAAIVRAQAASDALADVPQASELPSGGLLGRAERCIDASLGEHEFDAAALAQMLGVSRSRLYRAFVPRGGVSAAIRNARLDRARLRFASPDDRHRTHAEVAYACGFTDYPSFSRAFRRRFGTSPRDAKSR